MKVGLSLPTMLGGIDRSLLLEWCRRIEGDGYDTLGFGERIAYRNLEMFGVLSAAAAVTERVRIASTIVVLPMHSAVWVAKQSATIDVISDGRYTLGVGVGGRSEDYRALGRSFERRYSRLDAGVDLIRSVWAGESPGEGLDPVGPPPRQQHIPILSGAMGPQAIARSARWADGIAGFEMDPSPTRLAAAAADIESAWSDAGRSERPYLMTSFWFALGDDASDRLQRYARDYLGVFGDDLATALAAACPVAGAERVTAAVEAARAAGFDEIQLVPTTSDLSELDRLGEVLGGQSSSM